jgi:hypothetical protein
MSRSSTIASTRFGREHVERLGPFTRESHFVAFQREGAAHRPANGRFVVHHQNSHFSQFHRQS